MKRSNKIDINTKEYWGKVWRDWGQQEKFTRFNMVIDMIPNGSLVLDVGSATGTFSRLLKKNKPSCKIVGIDISEDGIRMAREVAPEIPYYWCDVKQGIPFKGNFFDVVVAQEIIEHMESPRWLISECSRVLKNDGVFIGSVPNEHFCHSPEHNWEFTKEEYVQLLSNYFLDNETKFWSHAGNPKVSIISKSKNKKSKDNLRIAFCGARWLGIECLKELLSYNLNVVAADIPRRTEKVWWNDVKDEDFVDLMGIPKISFKDIKDLNLDLCFSILYAPIFKKEQIENCKYGVINLHPAPLPFYRGCNSYSHAIENNELLYGVTLHYVNEKIDEGPIIKRDDVEIREADTAEDLYNRAQVAALNMFKRELPNIIHCARNKNKVKSIIQSNEHAKYYKRDSLKNKNADLKLDDPSFNRFVRSREFKYFEKAYIMLKNKKYFLLTKSNI